MRRAWLRPRGRFGGYQGRKGNERGGPGLVSVTVAGDAYVDERADGRERRSDACRAGCVGQGSSVRWHNTATSLALITRSRANGIPMTGRSHRRSDT
jgi:hypothetical protein